MALRGALEQLRSTGTTQVSSTKEHGLKKTSSVSEAPAPVVNKTNPFSLDDDVDDLFDFNDDFLKGGELALPKVVSTNCTHPTHSAQPFPTNSRKEDVVISKPTAIQTKCPTPEDLPGSTSLQKLRKFKFVKSHNSPTGEALLRKRPHEVFSLNDFNVNGSCHPAAIGPPLSKRRPPDVSAAVPMGDTYTSFGTISTTLIQSSQSHNLLSPPTTSTQLSHTNTTTIQTNTPNLSSSQSNPRFSSSHSHVNFPTAGHIATGTPKSSLSQDSLFRTPTTAVRSQRISKFASTLQYTNTTTPLSSPFNNSSTNLSFSTPTNQKSATVGSTPAGFRTPLSRQPAALVCTPTGDKGTTNVIRTPVTVKRKFPGPAGLLPSLAPGQCMDNIHIQPPSTPRPSSTPQTQKLRVSRGSSVDESGERPEGDCFSSGPWVEMLKDLDMNDSHSSTLLQYSISSAIKQALNKMLQKGKVPHLRVLLKSIAPAGKNASAVLKDPSDEILCTIHSKVFDDHQKELQPGAALILRQVSLFSPGPRKHYLNITPDNIVRVYPPMSASESIEQPHGILELSKIERMYNSENMSPPNHNKGLPSNQNTHTITTQRPPLDDIHTLTTSISALQQTNQMSNDSHISSPRDLLSNPVHRELSRKDDSMYDDRPVEECFDFQDSDCDLVFEMGSEPTKDIESNIQGVSVVKPGPATVGKETAFFNQLCEDDFDAMFKDMEAFDF